MTLIRFDECLSHRIVEAMRALGPPAGITLQHPGEVGEQSLADVDWIASFRAAGGRCIVTGDPKMRGRIAERAALEASGLVAIFPPIKGWYDRLKRYGQAAFLIRWLPEIARLAQEAEPGSHFRLPPTFELDPTRITELRRLTGPPPTVV